MDDQSNATIAGGEDDTSTSKHNKRIRVSQACAPCRLRKGKCDGRQPVCDVCKGLGIDCSYDPNPKRRGLRPGQYSSLERRALLAELMAAYVMEKVPEAEEHVAAFFCSRDPELSFLCVESKQAELDDLVKRWRNGPVSQWLRQMAARTDPALDGLSRFRSHPSPGAPSANGPNVSGIHALERDDAEDLNGLDLSSLPRLYPVTKSQDRSAQVPFGVEDSGMVQSLPQDHNLLPSFPSNIEELFDIYFAYTHTWLPLLDKFKLNSFARSFSRTSYDPSNISSLQSANLALLWAMIAYTSASMPQSARTKFGADYKMTPIGAAKLSLSLLPACDADMQHEHIQTLVLLSLFHLEYGSERVSWILIGLAGRMAVDLSCVKPGQHLSSISRRTALACFVVEGIIAAALDRWPQLPTPRSQEVRQTMGFPENNVCELEVEGWEEWSSWEIPGCKIQPNTSTAQPRSEPFRVLSTFNELILLVEVLNISTSRCKSLTEARVLETTQPTTSNKTPELLAWEHHISESHPSLAPEHLKNETNSHIINFHFIYWIVCYASYTHRKEAKDEAQRDKSYLHHLAMSLNDLVAKYRSLYPMNTAPLGLTASITIALRSLSVDDPLRDSLSQTLYSIRNGGDMTARFNEASINQQEGDSLVRKVHASGLLGGSDHKRRRVENSLDCLHQSALQGHPQSPSGKPSHNKAPEARGTVCYIQPQPSLTTIMNLPNGLDMDVMGVDLGDTSSLSAHDLTELDAAVWNDNLFTRNLGFIEDSQTALDPELGHLFDPFASV